MAKRVAVVTGGNKGIGFAIVRGLCKKFDGDVYLTARDEGRGKEAVTALEKEGLKPKFHLLDINDPASAKTLGEFLKKNYGGLDVLVNNAAIAYKAASTASFEEQAETSVKTNYLALRCVCDTLFPLLREHARVVHVASRVGTSTMKRMKKEKTEELQRLSTASEVDQFMKGFVQDVKNGCHQDKGWANTAYGTSKVGVIAITPIQQKEFSAEKDILINSCCPGYVNTDMTSGKGTRTPDEGADTPLYLALLPSGCEKPRGEFLGDRTVIDWKKLDQGPSAGW